MKQLSQISDSTMNTSLGTFWRTTQQLTIKRFKTVSFRIFSYLCGKSTMSLLSLILKEKDPNGNVRQLCGSDLSKISDSELEDYLLNVRRTNLDLSRTRLTRRQLRTVRLETISRFFIVHTYLLTFIQSLIGHSSHCTYHSLIDHTS